MYFLFAESTFQYHRPPESAVRLKKTKDAFDTWHTCIGHLKSALRYTGSLSCLKLPQNENHINLHFDFLSLVFWGWTSEHNSLLPKYKQTKKNNCSITSALQHQLTCKSINRESTIAEDNHPPHPECAFLEKLLFEINL